MINAPPHKYKLYPLPPSQFCRLLAGSQNQHENGCLVRGRLNYWKPDHVTKLLWRRLSEWDWWGPRLTEEESAGSAGRQFTPIVILYSATHCVLLSADTSCHTPSLHQAAAGLPPPHHRRPLHAVQHRYALIYEPSRPLKTSGHFPAKRKIAPPSGQ